MKTSTQSNLEKDKVVRFRIPSFKAYYEVMVIWTMWYWHRIDMEINGAKLSPEINTHIDGRLIFSKTIHWINNNPFNKCC